MVSGSVEGTPTHLLRVEYFQWGGEQAKCIAQGLAHTVLVTGCLVQLLGIWGTLLGSGQPSI